jgi:hypothetical protein
VYAHQLSVGGSKGGQGAKRADMTKHKGSLPIQGPGVPILAAQRIYELLDASGR